MDWCGVWHGVAGASTALGGNHAFMVNNVSLHVPAGSSPLGYGVLHDGKVIEFETESLNWRLWIDGELLTFLPSIAHSGDGNAYRVKFTFPGRAIRRLVFETPCWFRGISVGPTDGIRAHRPKGPRAIVMGDSFTEGTGIPNGTDKMGFAATLMQNLGRQGVFISGSGGTGYTNQGLLGRVKIGDRLQEDCLQYNPDEVWLFAGINDTFDETFQPEVRKVFSRIVLSPSKPKLFVGSPFWKSDNLPDDLLQKNAILKEECESAGGVFIDVLHPNFWTGQGREGAETGVGICDLYVCPDGTHFTQLGHDALAAALFELMK